MFVRVKSSVLGGAFGSLLTVFLMYHILKLSISSNTTEQYTHYLDSTEITNYTLIESLLSIPKVNSPDKLDVVVTPNSRSDNIHFTLDELKHLTSTSSTTSIATTTTTIIQYHSVSSLQLQLQAIHNRSSSNANNHVIHIVCATEKEKSTIEQLLSIDNKSKEEDSYQVSISKSNEKWFNHIQASSDYVIIMDKQVVPGQGYFDFIIGLLNTPQFHHTLIGTEQPFTNICQQDEAHYIHEIKDIYVLRKEWYSAVLSSLEKSVSQALLQSLNIPSVILPTSLINDQQLRGNTEKSCVNVYPNGIVFIKESANNKLDEMICNFAHQHDIVHLVVWGKEEDHSIFTCPASTSGTILYHSVVKKQHELDRIINKLSPSIVIYEKRENSSYNIKQENDSNDITFIGLPTKDTGMFASWMADLSLETLQKWHTPKINLIVATGGKRVQQLRQLFKSIRQANYLGDQIDLSIVMDEKSDKSLYSFVNNIQWNHGVKYLRHRISGVHPMQIFAEAWYPSGDDEYAIMLDDRIELSHSFYIWIKYTVLKYRYEQQQTRSFLFGISLYSPRIIDTDPSGRQLLLPPNHSPYLMQVPNSLGGALYFPEHWREFHDYITARLTDQATVKRGSGNSHLFKDSLLTSARSNKWMSSWRKYFDEMIYMRGYVMLYPSFGSSYSTMTTVSKATIKNKKKKELYIGAEKLYQVPLIKTTTTTTVRELPDLEILPVLDLHGKLVDSPKVLLERGQLLQRKFSACEPIIDHANDPSDMLCPFARWVTVPIDGQTLLPSKTIHLYG